MHVKKPDHFAALLACNKVRGKWGYARVSTTAQNVGLQLDAMHAAGVPPERVIAEHATGGTRPRPRLAALLERLDAGAVLVVWRFDRLARSTLELAQIAAQLDAQGVSLRSLTEGVDTGTPGGRLVYSTLAAVAELEREMIRERTRAGLQAARARGVHCGRPPVLGPVEVRAAFAWREEGITVREIAQRLRCSMRTVYNAMELGK